MSSCNSVAVAITTDTTVAKELISQILLEDSPRASAPDFEPESCDILSKMRNTSAIEGSQRY